MAFEQQYLTSLATVADYSISGQTLPLLDASGTAVLVFEGDFLRMTLPVMCLQNGGLGQQVRVLNRETKKTYWARVTALGVVTSVLPD